MKKLLAAALTILSLALPISAMGSSEEPSRETGPLIVREGHDFALLRGTDIVSEEALGAAYLRSSSVTLINIWATSCPACIRKMPDLAELQAILPEGAALLGIVLDGSARPNTVLEILDTYNITFPNIVPHSSMQDLLHRTAPYVPATVLVDSSGKIISGPYYGMKDIREYLAEFDRHL